MRYLKAVKVGKTSASDRRGIINYRLLGAHVKKHDIDINVYANN